VEATNGLVGPSSVQVPRHPTLCIAELELGPVLSQAIFSCFHIVVAFITIQQRWAWTGFRAGFWPFLVGSDSDWDLVLDQIGAGL